MSKELWEWGKCVLCSRTEGRGIKWDMVHRTWTWCQSTMEGWRQFLKTGTEQGDNFVRNKASLALAGQSQ